MSQRVTSMIEVLSTAPWLNAGRARAYLIILAAVSAAVVLVYIGHLYT